MNNKNNIYLVLLGFVLILLVGSFFYWNEKSNKVEGSLIYGKRNFLNNQTEIYKYKDNESGLVLAFSGTTSLIVKHPTRDAYAYLEDSSNPQLIFNEIDKERVILEKGRVSDEIHFSKDGNFMAYQVLKEDTGEIGESLTGEEILEKQNKMQVMVVNLENFSRQRVYEYDPISESFFLIAFSNDGKKLFFDRLDHQLGTAGEINILDIETRSIVQSYQGPSGYGFLGTPILSENQSDYAMVTRGESVWQIIKINLERTTELPLARYNDEDFIEGVDDIFWGAEDASVFWRVKSGSEHQGIWEIDLEDLDKKYWTDGEGVLLAAAEDGIVYEVENADFSRDFYWQKSSRSEAFPLVSGEYLFFVDWTVE